MAQTLRSRVGTGDKSEHGVDRNHRGAAVADQREGQADNGHNADAHAGVDHHLEHQRGRGTVAYQTAHIVLAVYAHIDAPGDDGHFHNHDRKAPHEAQLLAHGRENIVRVLGEQAAALGTVAVEQPLPRQAAAGEGTQVHHGVIALVDAHGVDGVVNQNQKPVLLVLAEELPQDRERRHDQADGQDEPPQADAAAEGHADEDKHEDQGNARVAGQHHVQSHQQSQVKAHVHNRRQAGYPVLVRRHDRRHNNDIGDLADLGGLNADEAQVDPASVAGVVVGSQRAYQHEKQRAVENHHHHPVFRKKVQIDGGHQRVHHDAQTGSRQLNDNIFEIAAKLVGGSGAGNKNAAKTGHDQAQDQQKYVAFFPKIL